MTTTLDLLVRNRIAVRVTGKLTILKATGDVTLATIDVKRWLYFFAVELAQFRRTSTHFRVILTTHGSKSLSLLIALGKLRDII